MRRIPAKIETRVFMSGAKKRQVQKREKIWVIAWLPVRKHSRSLYVPLPYEVVLLYNIRKGDLVKVTLHCVRHAPTETESLKDPGELRHESSEAEPRQDLEEEENESIHEVSENESTDEGEL